MEENILQKEINKQVEEVRYTFKEKEKEKLSFMTVLSILIAVAAILGLLFRFL